MHMLESIPCVLSTFPLKWYQINLCGTKDAFCCGRYGLLTCSIVEQILFIFCVFNLMITAGNSLKSSRDRTRICVLTKPNQSKSSLLGSKLLTFSTQTHSYHTLVLIWTRMSESRMDQPIKQKKLGEKYKSKSYKEEICVYCMFLI
jgi:hypothetical protein